MKKFIPVLLSLSMSDGKTKTFEYEKEPEFNVGDEVIVSGKYIYRKIQ